MIQEKNDIKSDLEVLHIACMSDNNFVPLTGALLVSIYENNRDLNTIIHYFHRNVTEDNLIKLKALAEKYNRELITYPINDSEIEHFINSKKRLPKLVYYRIYIPNIIQIQSDRLLYLDVDIIVNGSLKELVKIDFNNKLIAAVQDFVVPNEYTTQIGLDSDHKYFNSGAMLINLPKWLENDTPNKLLNYIENKPANLNFEDQDPLNVVVGKEVVYIDIKYNFLEQYKFSKRADIIELRKCREVRNSIENPIIIHFVLTKPNNPICMNYFVPLFYEYFKLTPWFDNNSLNYTLKIKINRIFLSILSYDTRFEFLFGNYSLIKRIIISLLGINNVKRLLRIKDIFQKQKLLY